MSIESFAAVVSDNDGSAFITKAEFDSLKNNFQSQIDQYNTSIDSKIDGAIASYLAGITVAKKTTEKFFDGKGNKALVADMCKINDLSWGYIGLDMTICSVNFPAFETNGNYSGCAINFPITRSESGTFEIFRYNKDTNKFIDYANDFNGKFKTTNIRIDCTGWTQYNSIPDPLLFRWHANYGVATPTKLIDYTSDFGRRDTYNIYLAAPGWCQMYGSGFNIGTAWAIGAESGSDNTQFNSSISSWTTTSETPIPLLFADDSNDSTNKLWTAAGSENSGIDIKYLVANYDANPDNFAVNYNKTSRTLQFDKPSDSGVTLGIATISGLNFSSSEDIRATSFGYPSTRAMQWTTGGDIFGENMDEVTACPWWEPYFENDSRYSKNIINNIDNNKISEFSSYGFTGALTEGIPIDLFKEDDECEFELNLPYAMSVGLRTNVFTAGTVILNTSNDANLEVTIDNVKKTNSNNEVAAGNHKFKIKYVGSGSKPIFIKIGRANADLSTTYRYIVTLPTEYTKTTT